MTQTTQAALSGRFIHALQFASHIHAAQRRKGGDIPYLSHLMAVSALVMDYGGTDYWKRFSVGRESQLWYYGVCLDAFNAGRPPPMLAEYRILFREFTELCDQAHPVSP